MALVESEGSKVVAMFRIDYMLRLRFSVKNSTCNAVLTMFDMPMMGVGLATAMTKRLSVPRKNVDNFCGRDKLLHIHEIISNSFYKYFFLKITV
jgi:hypothetical protein